MQTQSAWGGLFLMLSMGVCLAGERPPTKSEILKMICSPAKLEQDRCTSSTKIKEYKKCDLAVGSIIPITFRRSIYYLVDVYSTKCVLSGDRGLGGLAVVFKGIKGNLNFIGYTNIIDYDPDSCAIIRLNHDDAKIYCLTMESKFGITNQYLNEMEIKNPSNAGAISFGDRDDAIATDMSGFFDVTNQDQVDCDDKITSDRIYFRFDNLRRGAALGLLELDVDYIQSSDVGALCAGDFPHARAPGQEPDPRHVLVPSEKLRKDVFVYDSNRKTLEYLRAR